VSGALDGVRVIDFGQYLAGPLAAMLLADQGAEVVRVDPPGGPRWDTPINAVLLRGRRPVILDLHEPTDRDRAASLVASADVVIENFRPGVMERLGLGPRACLERAPQVVYCSMPGFGHDDPRAGVAAWEGVVMAAGGGYSTQVSAALIPGFDAQPSAPRFSPLPLASVFGAMEAAMAITAALIARDRDGVGQWVEVPLVDALFEASGLRAMSYERNGPQMTDFGSGFYRCADGRWLTFIATWFRHLEWFLDAAGCHGWIDEGVVDFDRLWSDPATVAELHQRMVDLFATRPAAEWERLGRDHGCTIGMLRSTSEWMQEPHAVLSGTLVDTTDPVLGAVRGPGLAVRLSTGPDGPAPPRRAPGSDTDAVLGAPDDRPRRAGPTPSPKPPLDGIRVIDHTRVVAGPTAAKLLGQLGADVIKIDEDPKLSRSASEQPSFHEHLNRAKRSLILDLKDAADRRRFSQLVAGCDVIVENFTIGTAERLGIDEASVRAMAPDVVFLYLNTYGLDGPWAAYRGFAELANITTGITERTCADDDLVSGMSAAMDFPRWPFTDYAAGVLGAFGALLGLFHRGRTGVGPRVETSLVRATALQQILYVLDHAGPCPPEPRGASATGWSPLQRLFATADGWVFVGATPQQVAPAVAALGAPTAELADAIRSRSTVECLAALASVGVGGHEVLSLAELMAPGGHADRRGLRLEDHSEHHGTVVMAGPVVRLQRTPMRPGAYPGPFGSDAEAILSEIERRER